MIKVTSDNVPLFHGKQYIIGQEQAMAMDAIATAIATKKPQVITLLRKHNITIGINPTKESLLSGLLVGFNKSKQFTEDFAKIVIVTHSTGSGRFSNATDDETVSNTASGGNMAWISGIINGVGGIIGLFNKPDAAALATQTNAQILAMAEAKERSRKINNTIAIIVVSLLVIGTGVGLFMYAKSQNK